MVLQILPFQDQLYYCAVDFPLTSLYLNSLLANLNARDYVRSAAVDVGYNSYPMGESTFRGTGRSTGTTQVRVRVPGSSSRLTALLGVMLTLIFLDRATGSISTPARTPPCTVIMTFLRSR